MDAPDMLQKMCREHLSDADIRAICKSRGFSAREASSRAIFENFFLSDIGVAAALATLTSREIATLRLLARVKSEVDIAFFARAYGDIRTSTNYYGTYNQRYADVMKQVQTSLIRRGLLLYAEAIPDDGETTKLQRLRFRFPVEFEVFLPPLAADARSAPGSGEVRSEVLRRKLLEVVGEGQGQGAKGAFTLSIVNGELRIGQEPFRVAALQQWQQASWAADLGRGNKKADVAPVDETRQRSLAPVEAVHAICATLAEGCWMPVEAFTPLLEVFCYGGKVVDGPTACAAGWRWGCLARQEVAGQMCYRLPADDPAAAADDPARYLGVAPDGAAIIDLQTVPYAALEQIVAVSELRPASSGPYLLATPHLVRLGRTTASARRRPALRWLQEHATAYSEAFALAEERWGKQIIHTNLLIARTTDPGLRVQIERALPDGDAFVSLSDEFIAFPNAALPAVERVVSKAGYVVKTVRAPGEK